mmetsp:Transcript_6908/g.21794  ORF Transcript_6908/g.21794 Transcript_6908/m.21794 type:complete len:305 (-) Transcript_6908:17-931(-)
MASSRLEEIQMTSRAAPGDHHVVEIDDADDDGASEFMARFFARVEDVKNGISVVKKTTSRIRQITEERMLSFDAESERRLSRELGALVDRTNRTVRRTKELLEALAAETEENSGQTKASETRIRENLVNTLSRKLGDVVSDYQAAQQRYKTQIEKTVQRQLQIVKPDVTQEEMDTVLRSGGTGEVFRSAILTGQADPIKNAYANVADKYQDVLKLEQSVAELHQMFLDFALLTEQQGEMLDQIEYQVKSAGEYIESGNADIKYAIQYQTELRRRRCCLICICLIVVGVIVLIALFVSRPLRKFK